MELIIGRIGYFISSNKKNYYIEIIDNKNKHYNCRFTNKMGNILLQYCSIGDLIAISGKYTKDKKTLIVEKFSFLK